MKIPALKAWLILCCGFAVSLFGQSVANHKRVSIVFDDWWNIDYVKNGCEMATQLAKNGNSAKPCTRNPEDTVREFENAVQIAFASERVCHGLELVRLTPEMINTAVKNPAAPAKGTMSTAATAHWSLMLDLDGRRHTQDGQGWSLVDPSNNVLNGKITTPKNLVQQVCKIAKGVGGVAK